VTVHEIQQYRAVFDAEVAFSNGGGLRVEQFRVDVPSVAVTPEEVAVLFVASLGLLMSDRVDVRDLRVVPEAHKGTRGGPSDASATAGAEQAARVGWRWVELSHRIADGMTTSPGLPAPEITAHLTRAASRESYAPGTEFAIDRISMVGNTGTYLDSPFHRYAGAADLAQLPLDRLADLPAIVVRTAGSGTRVVDVGALAAHRVAGNAVLLHTGGDEHWGSPRYAEPGPHLTEAAARWLVEHGAVLVGIDAMNIDDTGADGGGARPAHSVLLAAGIPIVEHLTGLAQLPPSGARFTAAPPRISGMGTFPVRAYAAVPRGATAEDGDDRAGAVR
jgi:kynurenine formamidase